MNWLGLTPDAIAERARSSAASIHLPTRGESLRNGALGLGIASTAVFAIVGCGRPWMFDYFGMLGPYLVAAALFAVLGGVALSRLVIGPARLSRFCLLFTIAFFTYAAVWVAAYFALGGLLGELVASLAGTPAAAMVIAWSFGAKKRWPAIVLWLTAANCAGYFVGRLAYTTPGGEVGMVLWGAIFGAVFGLGFGYVLFLAQEPVRRLLRPPA